MVTSRRHDDNNKILPNSCFGRIILQSTPTQQQLIFLLCLCYCCYCQAFYNNVNLPLKSKQLMLKLSSSSSSSSIDATAIETNLRHGLYKMEKVMTPSFFQQRNPILKQFYTKMNKNIEIKQSTIPNAGLGLFAKKPIKANTVISFYPSHTLGIDGIIPFITANKDDESYFTQHPPNKSSYLHCTDQPIFQRKSILDTTSSSSSLSDDTTTTSSPTVYLDVNPNRPIIDGWVSQYINDGATVTENSEDGVLEYYQQSKRMKNCIHIPFGPSPILATITTKKVKKGDEFFTSYGGIYWLGNFDNDNNVNITPAINKEIQQSANDLFTSLKMVSILYRNQIEALQNEFDKI